MKQDFLFSDEFQIFIVKYIEREYHDSFYFYIKNVHADVIRKYRVYGIHVLIHVHV